MSPRNDANDPSVGVERRHLPSFAGEDNANAGAAAAGPGRLPSRHADSERAKGQETSTMKRRAMLKTAGIGTAAAFSWRTAAMTCAGGIESVRCAKSGVAPNRMVPRANAPAPMRRDGMGRDSTGNRECSGMRSTRRLKSRG